MKFGWIITISFLAVGPWAACGDDSSSGNERLCGNGIVETGEECDQGSANSDAYDAACTLHCKLPACGDGILQSGEECDHGSLNSNDEPDACRTDCTRPRCGDGVADNGEQCDDGSLERGYDGCDAVCIATDFQVNSETLYGQEEPSVGIDRDGRFIVTWHSDAQDGSRYGIYAQRYDADGSPVGSEFQVNSHTTADQSAPSVALAQDRGFIVTWQSDNQDGSVEGIYAQRYDADGNPVGSEFRVNSYTPDDQAWPSVAMAPDGRCMVAWESNHQDGSDDGIFGKLFSTHGQPRGPGAW